MSDAEVNQYISILVKECPYIYENIKNTKHRKKMVQKHFKDIAECVTIKFNNNMTATEVQIRWKNLRNSFMRSHSNVINNNQHKKYYLYDTLSYLIDHVKCRDKNSNSENNCNLDNDNNVADEELCFEDIKHIVNEQENKENENTAKRFKSTFNKPEMLATAKPTLSKIYMKKKDALNNLELSLTKMANQTFMAVEKEIHENEERDYCEGDDDAYLSPIEEALHNVNADQLLDCVHEILDIIKEYQKKAH